MREKATEDQDALDLDLFCLELEHQVQTRITPELQRTLDERQAAFDAALDTHPNTVRERQRHVQERADYERRKERRHYVESGQAARAALQQAKRKARPARELASQLARTWRVPLILDPRLSAARPA